MTHNIKFRNTELVDLRGHSRAWLSAWYEIVKTFVDCDAALVITDGQVLDDAVGCYNETTNTISVGLDPNPYEVLTTLLHEVAHVMSNHRHSRPHGYSWRRVYAEIVKEFCGVDVVPLAKKFQREHNCAHRTALDYATVYYLTTERALIGYTGRENEWLFATVGRQHHRVRRPQATTVKVAREISP